MKHQSTHNGGIRFQAGVLKPVRQHAFRSESDTEAQRGHRLARVLHRRRCLAGLRFKIGRDTTEVTYHRLQPASSNVAKHAS